MKKLSEIRPLIALLLTLCTIYLAVTKQLTSAWITLYTGAVVGYYFTDKMTKAGDKDD